MADKRIIFSEYSLELVRHCLKAGDRLQALELFENAMFAFRQKGGKPVDEAFALQSMASSLRESGYRFDARRFSDRAQTVVDLIVSNHLSQLSDSALMKPTQRSILRLVR